VLGKGRRGAKLAAEMEVLMVMILMATTCQCVEQLKGRLTCIKHSNRLGERGLAQASCCT